MNLKDIMLKQVSNNITIKDRLIIVLTLIFTTVPFFYIVLINYYTQTKRLEFWQGGLTILMFIVVIFILSYKWKNKINTLILVFGAIYLSMNGVILPFIAAYIYFEMLHYIGFTILNIKKEEIVGGIIENFIVGISIWGMLAIICSLLNFGTFNDLRIMTIVLVIVCILLNNKIKYPSLFNCYNEFINKNNQSSLSRIFVIILTFVVLALVAKTNTATSYDALWYGLRPEHVLIGPNSFYDYLGYAAFVYYYPKLMELLFLPISNLKDYSFIISGNIIIFTLLISSIYRFFNRIFKNLNKSSNFKSNFINWVVLVIVTIPAITNIVESASPDILGAFLTVSAFVLFIEFLSDKKRIDLLIMALVSLFMSTGTKLTYILWAGLLFISIACALISLIHKKEISFSDFKFKNLRIMYLVAFSSVFFTLGVHYRTLKLTGYPLYPNFSNVFKALGFKVVYPADNIVGQVIDLPIHGIGYVFDRLYKVFFHPGIIILGKINALWVSSILPFMVILFILHFKKGTFKKNIFISIFTLLNASAFFYYIVSMPTPDGNYFIFPIVTLLLILVEKIYNNHELLVHKTNSKVIVFIIAMYIFLQVPIMFVSHISGAVGTRPFSNEIIRNNFGTWSNNENIQKAVGCYKIGKYISENMKQQRIISSSMSPVIVNRIDGPIEDMWIIESSHSNKDITANYENFYKYLKHAKIKGFLLLYADKSKFREYVERYIKENGYIETILDGQGVLYVLK